jgi:hypothetical protein
VTAPAQRRPLQPGPCDECGQPIIWAYTANGNPMPVDAKPSDNGNVLLDARHPDHRGRPAAGVLGAQAAAGARDRGQELRTHHRLTCTHPERWARKTRKARR